MRHCRLQLRLHIAGMGAGASNKNKVDLNKRRARLQSRIDSFNTEASRFFPEHLVDNLSTVPDASPRDAEFLALLEEDPDVHAPFILPKSTAENRRLCFPSVIGAEECHRQGKEALVEKELTLRRGQANDCLHGIRTTLGEKSFLFRHDLRLSDSKVKKTKAWTRLVSVNKKVNKERWTYEKARSALVELGADATILDHYKPLTRQDMRVSTAIMEPNAAGQRDASLPWFWTIRIPATKDRNASSENLLSEGRLHIPLHGF